MESTQESHFFMGEDMPHLVFMDEQDLTADKFSESLRHKLHLFDAEFVKAMTDGIVDEQEYYSLHTFSTELKSLMIKEMQPRKIDPETGALITIFSALGAAIGLGKIFRS